MDVVDAQLHFAPGPIEQTLAAMDAVGIRSVMLEEYWYWQRSANPIFNPPGFELPNGAWRAIYAGAELASARYPERFSYFVRIDRRDPQIESVMRVIASAPQARAFRFLATRTPEEAAAFRNGDFDAAFDIAQDCEMPVCLAIPGYVEFLSRYARKYPKLEFVIDHWGLATSYNTAGMSENDAKRVTSEAYLSEVLKLAEHPNVSLKISHAHMYFGACDYPYQPIRKKVRQAIKAFGAERVLWSTDQTVLRPALTWSDLLHYLRDDPDLDIEEKRKLLGQNARRIFNWPSAT